MGGFSEYFCWLFVLCGALLVSLLHFFSLDFFDGILGFMHGLLLARDFSRLV